MRNTAKDEKHKLKELSKRIKNASEKEEERHVKKRYNRFLKNSEASKVHQA